VVLLACGGGPTDGPEYPKAPPKAAEPVAIKEARPPAGSVWRDELIDTLNAGLGAFLQHVEVEASLEEGRFRGFRILQLIPPGYWEGVDLEPGDVLVSVNGMPVERETEAYAAFEALRSAKEIRVAVLRAGAPHETLVSIVERAGVSIAQPSSAAGAGGSTALTSGGGAGLTDGTGGAAGVGTGGASAAGSPAVGKPSSGNRAK
jgi:hypothetical protein